MEHYKALYKFTFFTVSLLPSVVTADYLLQSSFVQLLLHLLCIGADTPQKSIKLGRIIAAASVRSLSLLLFSTAILLSLISRTVLLL